MKRRVYDVGFIIVDDACNGTVLLLDGLVTVSGSWVGFLCMKSMRWDCFLALFAVASGLNHRNTISIRINYTHSPVPCSTVQIFVSQSTTSFALFFLSSSSRLRRIPTEVLDLPAMTAKLQRLRNASATVTSWG